MSPQQGNADGRSAGAGGAGTVELRHVWGALCCSSSVGWRMWTFVLSHPPRRGCLCRVRARVVPRIYLVRPHPRGIRGAQAAIGGAESAGDERSGSVQWAEDLAGGIN